jgi:hypothetical protein
MLLLVEQSVAYADTRRGVCIQVGHFVMDRSYLIQCTYRTEGLDRHVIYFLNSALIVP